MANKRSQRLTPVAELAKKASDEALSKVGQMNAIWMRDKAQLKDLQQYREDYLMRFRGKGIQSMPVQKVMELRAFLVQLDRAISSQEQQVAQSLTVLEQAQQAWKVVHSREQALQSLITRYHQEDTQLALKQEQRESDERNTSLWFRKPK